MEVLFWKYQNYGREIEFTIQQNDGSIQVLTGMTLNLKVWRDSSLEFSVECELVDEDAGTAKYATKETDFGALTVDEYYAEIQMEKTGYRDDTETFMIKVKQTAPES